MEFVKRWFSFFLVFERHKALHRQRSVRSDRVLAAAILIIEIGFKNRQGGLSEITHGCAPFGEGNGLWMCDFVIFYFLLPVVASETVWFL